MYHKPYFPPTKAELWQKSNPPERVGVRVIKANFAKENLDPGLNKLNMSFKGTL